MNAALTFLAGRSEVDAGRTGILGVSLAAAAGIVAAADLPQVRAVVADSAFASSGALFDRLLTPDPLLHLPLGTLGLWLAGLIHGVHMRRFRRWRARRGSARGRCS